MSTDGGGDDLTIKLKIDRTQSKAQVDAESRSHQELARAADAAAKKAGAAAVGASRQRATSAKEAADAEVESFARSGDALGQFASQGKKDLADIDASASGLIETFSKFAGSVITVNALGAAFRSVTGTMADAVEFGKKQVDQLLQLKNSLRDIATMTGGKGGSTDAEVQKHLDIRTKSGLDVAGAHAFVEGYAGAGEARKGINISEAEYEASKPLLAKFAAASSGGDAGAVGAYGNLSGLMLGYGKNQTARGVLAKMTGFNKILGMGVGDNPTLIREAAQQAGALLNSEGTGIVSDPLHLGALIATASLQRSPGQAGTVIQQSNKVLRGFTGPAAGMLAAAGITPADKLPESFNKLFARMEEAERAGIAPDQFLAAGGVQADEDRASLAAMYAGRAITARGMGMAARPPSEAQAEAELEAKYRADVALQANVGQAKVDEAKMHNAMLLQHMKPLELEAEARLTARGEGEDSAAAAAADESRGWWETGMGFFRPSGMTNQQVGRKIRMEAEMNKILKERGIDVPGRPSDATVAGGFVNPMFVPWLTGAGMQEAYAQATSTAYLGQQVMPGGVTPPRVTLPQAHAAARGPESQKVVGLLEQIGTAIVGALNPLPRGPLPPARPGPGWTR